MECDADALKIVQLVVAVVIQLVYFFIIVIYAGIKFEAWWNFSFILVWIGFNGSNLLVLKEW